MDVNLDMVYTIAAYHDIGHHIDSKTHEIISADIMSKDKNLSNYFNSHELSIIKEAIEDHRASLKDDPRSIYGRIVSSADRNNKVEDCLRRTYTYGKKLNPDASDEELFLRAYDVLVKKFVEDGYAKFYFKDSEYENFLIMIRELLKDKDKFINKQRKYIDKIKKEELEKNEISQFNMNWLNEIKNFDKVSTITKNVINEYIDNIYVYENKTNINWLITI